MTAPSVLAPTAPSVFNILIIWQFIISRFLTFQTAQQERLHQLDDDDDEEGDAEGDLDHCAAEEAHEGAAGGAQGGTEVLDHDVLADKGADEGPEGDTEEARGSYGQAEEGDDETYITAPDAILRAAEMLGGQ